MEFEALHRAKIRNHAHFYIRWGNKEKRIDNYFCITNPNTKKYASS